MKKQKIAFLGTGIMGVQMARRLAQADYSVTAWNRTREKADVLCQYGVHVANTPHEAAANLEQGDTAIVMVSDGPTSDLVIRGADDIPGLADAMPNGSTIVVMSSIPVETAQAQAEFVHANGQIYIDAPVSGGEPGATQGTLAIMAGGDKAAFDAHDDMFSVLGRATYLGPAGTGSLAKLANQVIVGNTISTVAEALLLVEAGGGNPAALADALMGGFADSPILQNHGRRMTQGNFTPGAPVRLQHKDMKSANELAEKLGLTLPLAQQAEDIYLDLMERGQEERDHNAAFIELRRRNGLDT